MPNRVRLHIENDSSLGAVFEVTEDRLSAAFSRFPDLAERVDCSIGYDCADFDRQIADADALVCWDIDHRNIAKRAPKLRWIHATGAGVEHFTPFDWLPEGVVVHQQPRRPRRARPRIRHHGGADAQQPGARDGHPSACRPLGADLQHRHRGKDAAGRRRGQRRRRRRRMGQAFRDAGDRRAADRETAPGGRRDAGARGAVGADPARRLHHRHRARHRAHPPPDRQGGDRGDPARRRHRQLRPRPGGRLRGAARAAGAARDQRHPRRVRPRAAARPTRRSGGPPT